MERGDRGDVTRPAMAVRVRQHFRLFRYTRWMRDAQPTARVFFGVGDDLESGCDTGVAHFMRDCADFGFVEPIAPRRHPLGEAGCLNDYIAVRTARAWPKAMQPEVVASLYLDVVAQHPLEQWVALGGMRQLPVGALQRVAA